MIAQAKLRYLRTSPQKARLVVDQIRGEGVGRALTLLRFSRKAVARDVAKLLRSAVANAQQSDPGVDVDALMVAQAHVDEAPPLKRSMHRAMGRVFPIRKRACHVTVKLDVPGTGEKAARSASAGG